MKFSVLLPTRNRVELLSYAVQTVLRQDYSDWEIIVSDNCSEEDVKGYVASLEDDRIKYCRTETFVPVTDNWNNAIDNSTGDYVIMLGDDDCLMQGYFSTLRELLERHSHPDLVYTSAFNYAYPGVLPGHPDGFLKPYGYADFLQRGPEPFFLAREEAVHLVKQSMRFRVAFGFNMQFALVSRAAIDSMTTHGSFYQSPYPDYYAMNALMLDSARILIVPKPLVTIGISPKSFGFFYFNESEQAGVEFLKNLPDERILNRVADVVLPGSDMNTSWLLSMETVKVNFGATFPLEVDYGQYRRLQVLGVLLHYTRAIRDTFTPVWRRLTVAEKLKYGVALRLLTLLPDRIRRRIVRNLLAAAGTYVDYSPPPVAGNFETILDVFDAVDPLGV